MTISTKTLKGEMGHGEAPTAVMTGSGPKQPDSALKRSIQPSSDSERHGKYLGLP